MALRPHLEQSSTDKNTFDFLKEFKTETFKLIQSRELQRMVTKSGQLVLTKSGTGNYVYPLITTILDTIKSDHFADYVIYLNSIFKPYEIKDTDLGT